MVFSTSKLDPYDEGYPRSSEADLDPGPELSESLDDADRVASDEHRVVPGGRRPDGPTDDEDRYEDADDRDDAGSRH
jgi:hypothetical protein